jgi:NAD-dependent deacetylase
MKRKIVIFSGAGISQESGIKTFRDSDGTWEEYKIEDVATPEAFANNTQVFLDFYNMRKNQMKTVFPNEAHNVVFQMENEFDVTIVTQNVDDLHEKAGSNNVIHLHGELSKMMSSYDNSYKKPYIEDIKIGTCDPLGEQMRPFIVLFGEGLPEEEVDKSITALEEADVIVIVGTSMQVEPARSLPWTYAKETTIIYYVDPADMDILVPKSRRGFFYHIKEKASIGIKTVYEDIKSFYCK